MGEVISTNNNINVSNVLDLNSVSNTFDIEPYIEIIKSETEYEMEHSSEINGIKIIDKDKTFKTENIVTIRDETDFFAAFELESDSGKINIKINADKDTKREMSHSEIQQKRNLKKELKLKNKQETILKKLKCNNNRQNLKVKDDLENDSDPDVPESVKKMPNWRYTHLKTSFEYILSIQDPERIYNDQKAFRELRNINKAVIALKIE